MDSESSDKHSAVPKLTKSSTFSPGTATSSGNPLATHLSRNSADQGARSKSEKILPSLDERSQSDVRLGSRSSILDDSLFGRRYAYGAVEGAALNPTEPWRVAAAVGRDVGQYVLGRIGWKPSSAEPETDPSQLQHDCCKVINARLKVQADERAKEEAKKKEASLPDPKAPDVAKSNGSLTGQSKAESDGGYSSTEEEDSSADSIDKQEKNLGRVSTASTQVSGDITTSGTGHYEPGNDALCRLETIVPAEVKFLNIALWTWLAAATGFLASEFAQKFYAPQDGVLKNYNKIIINVVMGGFCFALISGSIVCHFWRIWETIKYKKIWRPRRKYFTILATTELCVQWLNLLFFLLPNVESFGPHCFRIKNARHIAYFSLVRWTCWNTLFLISLIHGHSCNLVSREAALSSSSGQKSLTQGRKSLNFTQNAVDVTVMDMPFLQVHWWKFILWGLMEASVLACHIYYALAVSAKNQDQTAWIQTEDCSHQIANCRVDNVALGLAAIMFFFSLIYFFLYCYFVQRGLKQVQERSAMDFKIANIVIRLQMLLRLPAFGFFILSLLLLWFVKPFACTSLIDTWFGMLPGQLAATGSVLLLIFLATPKSCGGTAPILQVWLQEFAWTEEEKPRKLARRNASLPPEQLEDLQKEPMFCVETMFNCLYWSLLAYDFREVEDSKLSLDEAAGLFSPPLDQFELFWEKKLDTKLLLAWSRERIVLAFRGTASKQNVLQDLQAWRQVHQPKRGTFWRRPKVHSGFDKAWRSNNFSLDVIARIKEIINSGYIDKEKLKMTVTGHSLGGAMATLAAYDMRAVGKKYGKDCKVTCITFGAPRTGNHAFAKDFQEMVPDCWHIINDQDVVARGGKLWVLYKRGGHRVLINSLGDLLVRPSAMENSIRLVPCIISGSIVQHLLTSYLRSLLSMLVSQFNSKRIKGGMTGVVQLAKESVPIRRLLLEEAELEYKDLVKLMRWGPNASRVAAVANLSIDGRKKTKRKDRKLDTTDTTRGGMLFSCCAHTSVKMNDTRGKGATDEKDTNVVDGGEAQVVDEKSKEKEIGDHMV